MLEMRQLNSQLTSQWELTQHHFGKIFSYIPMKKNTFNHRFPLIKSRQDISTEKSGSLMIFAL